MKIESDKLLETIMFLKKDNAKNCKIAKKENVMVNWDMDRVKSLVDVYLDNVLRLITVSQSGKETKQ